MSGKIISLRESNCKNCLKCIRNCPTKAISFEDGQPTIIEDQCLACGRCYLICPQSAKEIRNEKELIRNWLMSEEKVVISVAPSYLAVWPNFNKLKQALLELGFYAVEETAQGAAYASNEYDRLINENKLSNIIETCCPVIVSLVEHKYPELISQLSPVPSAMIIHGKMLKERYPDCKVVFLSPCIAKQKEIIDERNSGSIDAIISMNVMDEWLMDIDDYESSELKDSNIARLFPVSGGIIKTLHDQNIYKTLSIEGLERCEEAIKSIANGHLKGYFFEMNSCLGGCFGGPYLHSYRDNEWLATTRLTKFENDSKPVYTLNEELNIIYEDKMIETPKYQEYQIIEILKQLGKTSKDDELNCGACGYDTCRDKAIAVLQGYADPNLCLPFALEKAQSMSNLVMSNTPNAIIVVDKEGIVTDINPAAIAMLTLQNYSVKGFSISSLLPHDTFLNGIDNINEQLNFTYEYEVYNKILQHAIIPLIKEEAYLIILMDLTEDKKQKDKMREIQKETIDSTQKVIDKQMRVVQEIASLLGETTAETKVVLTRLNNAINEDNK